MWNNGADNRRADLPTSVLRILTKKPQASSRLVHPLLYAKTTVHYQSTKFMFEVNFMFNALIGQRAGLAVGIKRSIIINKKSILYFIVKTELIIK
jgi:hypothetical protein